MPKLPAARSFRGTRDWSARAPSQRRAKRREAFSLLALYGLPFLFCCQGGANGNLLIQVPAPPLGLRLLKQRMLRKVSTMVWMQMLVEFANPFRPSIIPHSLHAIAVFHMPAEDMARRHEWRARVGSDDFLANEALWRAHLLHVAPAVALTGNKGAFVLFGIIFPLAHLRLCQIPQHTGRVVEARVVLQFSFQLPHGKRLREVIAHELRLQLVLGSIKLMPFVPFGLVERVRLGAWKAELVDHW